MWVSLLCSCFLPAAGGCQAACPWLSLCLLSLERLTGSGLAGALGEAGCPPESVLWGGLREAGALTETTFPKARDALFPPGSSPVFILFLF